MKVGSIVRLKEVGTINGILVRIVFGNLGEVYFNVRTVWYPLDRLEVICEGR